MRIIKQKSKDPGVAHLSGRPQKKTMWGKNCFSKREKGQVE
jgi:hypothetical protein